MGRNESETNYFQYAYCIMGEKTNECGEEMNSLISVIKKYSDNGKPVKTKRIQVCDSGFCTPAKDFIRDKITNLEKDLEIFKNLQKIL